MGDGGLEWAFLGCPRPVDVDPLVVEGGVGKEVDALLRQLHVVRHTDILAEQGGKLVVIVDYNLVHYRRMLEIRVQR